MSPALRSLWDEPRVANAPGPMRRDWAIVAALGVVAMAEGLLRPNVEWRPVALASCLWFIATTPWRRVHPRATVVAVFGVFTLIEVFAVPVTSETVGLYTAVAVLVLPYCLLRWGSGRDVVIGLATMCLTAVVASLREITKASGVGNLVGGTIVLLLPAAVGAAIRFRDSSKMRAIDQIKLLERERIARDLHDTVAHHVSAIAVQAQAGRAVLAARPEQAAMVFDVIEDEASRTLAEMRSMVGSLRRDGETIELAPQRGLADVVRLGSDGAAGLRVDVAHRETSTMSHRPSERRSSASHRNRSPTHDDTLTARAGSKCVCAATRTT